MSKKPNFITILLDDMGWRDLSYAGSDFYESPNIDALREREMTFTRAYAVCPVCSPTCNAPERTALVDVKYCPADKESDLFVRRLTGIIKK